MDNRDCALTSGFCGFSSSTSLFRIICTGFDCVLSLIIRVPIYPFFPILPYISSLVSFLADNKVMAFGLLLSGYQFSFVVAFSWHCPDYPKYFFRSSVFPNRYGGCCWQLSSDIGINLAKSRLPHSHNSESNV